MEQRLRKIELTLERLRKVDSPPLGIGCRVYNSANISVNNATTTALTFDSERYDPAGMHSTSVNTGRVTVTHAGKHLMLATASFAANATGFREVGFRINGTIFPAFQDALSIGAGNPTIVTCSTVFDLAVGDYIEVVVHQTSGGALNVLASTEYSPEFSVHRLA